MIKNSNKLLNYIKYEKTVKKYENINLQHKH